MALNKNLSHKFSYLTLYQKYQQSFINETTANCTISLVPATGKKFPKLFPSNRASFIVDGIFSGKLSTDNHTLFWGLVAPGSGLKAPQAQAGSRGNQAPKQSNFFYTQPFLRACIKNMIKQDWFPIP